MIRDKNIKNEHIREFFKYIFSFALIKHFIYSFAYMIHDHVAWRREIHAGEGFRVHPTTSIRNAKNIYVGHDSHFSMNSCIWAGLESKIIIGDNLMMGPGVSMQAANHDTSGNNIMMTRPEIEADIIIGNDCWICSNVTITAGVTIPDGCVIAAGSVVTRSIDKPYSIVGGVPAKFIRARN